MFHSKKKSSGQQSNGGKKKKKAPVGKLIKNTITPNRAARSPKKTNMELDFHREKILKPKKTKDTKVSNPAKVILWVINIVVD